MALILTPAEIATVAKAAGFTGEALVTAIATAIAESGGRADARGDVGLQTDKWGPSIGLWQIRSLNAEKGRGGQRDEIANLDPWTNAKNAYAISGKGTNFGPWSVYGSGKYRDHLVAARAAAANPAAEVQGRAGSSPPSSPGWIEYIPNIPGVGLMKPLGQMGDAMGSIAKTFGVLGGLADKLMWFALPSTWLRIVTGGFGIGFIFFGIAILGKEARNG